MKEKARRSKKSLRYPRYQEEKFRLPSYKIASNPTISISEVKRRFRIIDRSIDEGKVKEIQASNE